MQQAINSIEHLPEDLQQAIVLYSAMYRAQHPRANERNVRRALQRKFGIKFVSQNSPIKKGV